MPLIVLILLIAAFVFALMAAFNMPSRFNMIGNALACYFLSIILPLLRTLFLITACLMVAGCATTTTWQQKLAPESLANRALVSVADHYGGKKAANLTSAGLSATAEVLQGYVDKKPPIDIITKSPGVEGVGHVVIDYLKDKKWISQETVNNLHKAAAFAARLTYTADPK